MFFTNALVALAGFGSLIAAAPAPLNKDALLVSRDAVEARDTTLLLGGSNTIIVQQTVVQPQVTIVEQNLDLISQLALVAEQELNALVQSQLALIQQVETIKNNIRVNTFRSRFSTVNTVIVCVTQLVDLRGGETGRNTRYMINQLLADNAQAESSVVVMVTAASPITINAAQPTLDLAGLLGDNSTALPSAVVASVLSAASASVAASASAAANTATPQIAAFDSNNPFGQLNQTIILPYGSSAPSLASAQVFADPASIILPNQNNLLVENIAQFSSDCQLFTSNSLSLFNLQSALIQAQQIAALELSGLTLGSAAALNSAIAALQGGTLATTTTTTTTLASTTAAAAVTTTAATTTATTTTAAVSTVTSAATSSSSTTISAAVAGAAAEATTATAAVAGASGGVGVAIVPVPSA